MSKEAAQKDIGTPADFAAAVEQYYADKEDYHTLLESFADNAEFELVTDRYNTMDKSKGAPDTSDKTSDTKGSGGEAHPPLGQSAGGTTKATTADHQANPGPRITQDLPAEEGTREEREKRMAELNK